ncbi:hypothetical protein H257_09266 [Aphanomyces astaci]|uniref:Uncharacterized protein n=2 Tax=Aphanomyces astaci TaxID=112090 RepID=W4GCM0_APHAT|nr:hypothetical protein H257_09266 [Aphanomyces astaci]ETV76819.1 hypothetical protein H257_09266 [Aphanomyces astaci]|eukprot:XP_009833731.1 hypothetical protein H257_09266 [Aphanomyces astaci]
MLRAIFSLAGMDISATNVLRHLQSSYEYSRGSATTVLVIAIALIAVLVYIGLRVTFWGMTSPRLSIFLSTLVAATTMLGIVLPDLVTILVGFVLALILSLVPACRKVGIVAIGAAYGTTVVDLLLGAIKLISSDLRASSIALDIVALVAMVVAAAWCGVRALKEHETFLVFATSCTGAFVVSGSIAAAIVVVVVGGMDTSLFYYALWVCIGAGLMFGGVMRQAVALNQATPNVSVTIATPVKDNTIV